MNAAALSSALLNSVSNVSFWEPIPHPENLFLLSRLSALGDSLQMLWLLGHASQVGLQVLATFLGGHSSIWLLLMAPPLYEPSTLMDFLEPVSMLF